MIVYHASYRQFDRPNLKFAKSYRDFGRGFYVTECYIDAFSILKGKQGYIYHYELNDDALNWLQINDAEILDRIIEFRTKNDHLEYDAISGLTASGQISKLFKQLRNGKDCLDELKQEIKFNTYKEQICLKTDFALSQLKLLEVENIYE